MAPARQGLAQVGSCEKGGVLGDREEPLVEAGVSVGVCPGVGIPVGVGASLAAGVTGAHNCFYPGNLPPRRCIGSPLPQRLCTPIWKGLCFATATVVLTNWSYTTDRYRHPERAASWPEYQNVPGPPSLGTDRFNLQLLPVPGGGSGNSEVIEE